SRLRRKALGGNVETGQTAYAATDKINQRHPVPCAAQACGKTERRGRDAEGKDVGQRIEFPSKRRMMAAPSRHAPVKDIEYKGGCHHARCTEKISERMAANIEHGEKYRCDTAPGIAQREKICQVETANH